MKLTEATSIFLGQYKKSSRKAYASALKPLQQYIGTHRPVTEISELEMIQYTNHLRERDYSPATLRKHIKALKTFFNWMVARKLIEASPAKAVKNVRYDMYIGRDKAMSDQQLAKLLAYMDVNRQATLRQRALVLFLADTGCRSGGAAGLRWSDIDFAEGKAIVTEKGNKSRPAWFFEVTTFALLDWQKAQVRRDGDYVFSYRGGKLSSSGLQHLFRRTCIAAGIGSHGPHKLRHRKAHQLMDEGIGVSIAATVIGDEPETFIAHYAPKDFESAKAAAKRVAQRPPTEGNILHLKRKISKA